MNRKGTCFCLLICAWLSTATAVSTATAASTAIAVSTTIAASTAIAVSTTIAASPATAGSTATASSTGAAGNTAIAGTTAIAGSKAIAGNTTPAADSTRAANPARAANLARAADSTPAGTTAPPTPARFTTADTEVHRIFELTDQRLAIMPAVAAVKWQTQAPIYDPPRETAVIQRAADLGAPMGLSPDPVKHLFELQARLAREVQTALHAEWKAHGFPDSQPITPLAALRPKLDALTTAILQAIYLAAPVLQRDDFETHYVESAQKQLQTSGWTDANRHELLSVLHTITLTPAPALQRVSASNTLRIGTTGDYAPFSLEDNGTLTGSDIDRAQQLATHLHAIPVFIHTTWSSMSDDLSHGAFDIAMGGVSVTPAREAVGAFSTPYASGGKTILARCADKRKFNSGLTAVDQRKVRVIVNPGGTNEQYVRTNLHHAQIVVFPDNRGIFKELIARHADVMITDDAEADLQSKNHPELCRAFAGTLTHADKAIFMPHDPELLKVINDWLAAR